MQYPGVDTIAAQQEDSGMNRQEKQQRLNQTQATIDAARAGAAQLPADDPRRDEILNQAATTQAAVDQAQAQFNEEGS